MNSLFNSALKQSSSVRRDLDTFAETPATSSPALQGQISASLTSFSRTIDDYAETAKKELIQTKQEKAQERIKNFKAELHDYRQTFERLKRDRDASAQQTTFSPASTLPRRPHHTSSTPENPYTSAPAMPSNSPLFSGPQPTYRNGPGQLSFGASPSDYTREDAALHEQSFLSQTNTQLDEYLERGRAVLGDLGAQREMLKGTQKKLYSVANTLGVSGDTIRMVERRAKQDKWIFWGGVAGFGGFCWLVIHFLR
ncbi:MAG: hypothetical protein Q9191_004590 [Dirinaria sp. TL-2023a]